MSVGNRVRALAVQQFLPVDATTNPSLLRHAAQLPQYAHLVEDAVRFGKGYPAWRRPGARHARTRSQGADALAWTLDKLAVNFGAEILKLIPGRVSTEVDARYVPRTVRACVHTDPPPLPRLSFDVDGTVQRARRLIQMYKDVGVPSTRVLVKIASTWEGIQAARILETEHGIQCNLTLLFSFAQVHARARARAAQLAVHPYQAVACADAQCTLISPFVGRILDWYTASTGATYDSDTDPGVLSVRRIYNYYKAHGHRTIVMGASFRNVGEVLALAGCDYLTISPTLLAHLQGMPAVVGGLPRALSPDGGPAAEPRVSFATEAAFRWALNEDAMATEKLAEGIRNFSKDHQLLAAYVEAKYFA